ncbi:hypothetical protein FORC89_2717 [Salmonella sp. FORC89]|uniref:Uncharacterized protein n=3 Tax=Salmonella dublin TaxID=98360 RepID=M7S446_SALDU|nr:hypothetical protein SeD_A1393 [Salmonella enterica subsp. enterica serovar Dublin str. CT_02021853]AET54077.1 putative phage membrane protein [Salmonella enterica subsp. enterica serovar Gallinarum/Pullorum str. RKS5078]AGU64576.1 putative phage membrane protein [Salmonella enterica subsp. enterica serovar Gallinarum/Pullorum str. CDC1983-67]ATD44987.1 hypothetical protein FORC51_2771 [Salmonella enterica]AUC49704.1 putative exported protein [Salmonella enterica subsp. enterica serovar Typh
MMPVNHTGIMANRHRKACWPDSQAIESRNNQLLSSDEKGCA